MIRTLVQLSFRLLALAACAMSLSAQTTISLIADKDTTLYEDPTGSLANGAGTGIFIGRVGFNGGGAKRRALVHFDVAGSVPAGARIVSATFELFAAQSSAFLPIQTDAHRVTQDWSEGSVIAPGQGGAGGPSAPGEATWLHTNYPNAFWATAGGDFAPTPSFSFGLPGIGQVSTEPLPGLVADVQDWLDNPAGNFGWLLKTDELQMSTARRCNSREAAGMQPKLNITYMMPGDVGVYGTGWPVGTGTFDLTPSGAAVGGTTVTFHYTNAPAPSIGASFFALDLDPIGTLLLPTCACSTFLPLSNIIPGDAFVVPAGGVASSQLAIPPASPGFLIVVQAAVIDATPLGFSLSNAGLMFTL
ncbi:MAG TPA: DNRLRE domain-containing protein [bacterium]|nr:DNRLRE domain-containing protein [bacterium]